MKPRVSIAIIIILLAVIGGVIIVSSLNSGGTEGWMVKVAPAGSIPSPVQTAIGTITINTPVPQGPATVPLYHGAYGQNDKIDYSSPNSGKIQNSIPEVSEVPLLAEQALAPYGGIPPDAVSTGIFKSTSKSVNLATGEVVATYLDYTTIGYSRELNRMPVFGSNGQSIYLEFGENGELLHLHKKWLTLRQIDEVPIITSSQAADKLLRGEVLNHYQEPVDVIITNISLGYYEGYPERAEELLEPVWIFSGSTSHGNALSFYVDARVSGSSLQFGNFTASPTTGPAPLTVQFTDTSTGPVRNWRWDFGDGTIDWTQNPVHIYQNKGLYTVKLLVSDDERDNFIEKTNYVKVGILTPPVANFTASNTTGKVPLTVQFNDTTTNAPTGWNWTFGDGTYAIEQNPSHIFTNVGNYSVSLTATNPDGTNTKTMTDLITVLPLTPPIPNFTATPRSGRAPLTVVFNDTSSGGKPTLWYWTFGDGADAAGPDVSHTYTTPGNYTVVLEVANEDGDVFETRPDYIQVLPVPTPVADFSADVTSGKAPLVVKFADHSTNEPTSWAWTFGDGYVSTEQNPVHQYDVSGTYTVNLTASNAGGNTTKSMTNYITVVKPSDPITLIDQLIVYIQNQNNLPKILQRLMVGELKDVKQSLGQNRPDDAVLGMKVFKMTVSVFKGWPLTSAQAATMQTSADAIIKEINLPVNQAAIDQTKSLSADVKSLKLSSSVERPLLLELEGTVFNLEIAKDQAAITHLNMFISSVKAQDGKKIPHDKAVQLVTKAQGIITTIKP